MTLDRALGPLTLSFFIYEMGITVSALSTEMAPKKTHHEA